MCDGLQTVLKSTAVAPGATRAGGGDRRRMLQDPGAPPHQPREFCPGPH